MILALVNVKLYTITLIAITKSSITFYNNYSTLNLRNMIIVIVSTISVAIIFRSYD